MTIESNIHAWFIERISAYLTDGLDERDQVEFESHAGQCAECSAKLAEAKSGDEILRGMFENTGPSAEFEDRVIRRLRMEERPRFAMPRMRLAMSRPIRLHPAVLRAAGAAAAIIVLGGLGYSATQMIQGRRATVSVASNLRQMGEAVIATKVSTPDLVTQLMITSPTQDRSQSISNSSTDSFLADKAPTAGFKMVQGLPPTFAVGADVNPGHGKDGQNVQNGLGRKEPELAQELASSANLVVLGVPQDSPYSYRDHLTAPAPGSNAYFAPQVGMATGDAARRLEDASKLQQMAAVDLERNTAFRVPEAKSANSTQTPPSEATPKAPTAPPPADQNISSRKVIRHGEMSFEVDSFDSAFMQITKIAAEEGGICFGYGFGEIG